MNEATELRRRQADLQDRIGTLRKQPPSGSVSLVGTVGVSPPSGVVFVPVTVTGVSGPISPSSGDAGVFSTSYAGFALNLTGGTVEVGDRVGLTQVDGVLFFEA